MWEKIFFPFSDSAREPRVPSDGSRIVSFRFSELSMTRFREFSVRKGIELKSKSNQMVKSDGVNLFNEEGRDTEWYRDFIDHDVSHATNSITLTTEEIEDYDRLSKKAFLEFDRNGVSDKFTRPELWTKCPVERTDSELTINNQSVEAKSSSLLQQAKCSIM